MKVYVVDPHYAEADNYVYIEEGITLSTITRGEKRLVGIPLGYFTQRDRDTEGAPLSPKFLKVADGVDGETVTRLNLVTVEGRNMQYARKVTEEEDTDPSDICLIYLRTSNPQGRAQFWNSSELRQDHTLFEGRLYEENVVHHVEPKTKRPKSCCPSLLVMRADETIQFTYINTLTDSNRLATLRYDGNELTVTENVARQPIKSERRPKFNRKTADNTERKISRPKNISNFGSGLADLLDTHPEFALRESKQKFRNDRNNRARRRELDKAHRRYDD